MCLDTATDPFALLTDGMQDLMVEYVHSRLGFVTLLDMYDSLLDALVSGLLENSGVSKDPLDVLVRIAMCPLTSGNTLGLLARATVPLAVGTLDPVAEWIGG